MPDAPEDLGTKLLRTVGDLSVVSSAAVVTWEPAIYHLEVGVQAHDLR